MENMDGNMYYYMQFGENNDRKVSFLDKVGEKQQKLVNIHWKLIMRNSCIHLKNCNSEGLVIVKE